jgi:threonine dehydrogenase-like Zn-dependent dehydrogenase
MTESFHWPDLRVGQALDGSTIESAATMDALVYFGRGDYRVVANRPIIGTAHDVIARVLLVHRCGTDVKIYQSGRPDQAEESLLQELAALLDSEYSGDSRHFLKYVHLLENGAQDDSFSDPLYDDVARVVEGLRESERAELKQKLCLYWGRIFGHEAVIEIVRVGSRVRELTEGIGYLQGQQLEPEYLDFQLGEICTLQSRIAHYRPPHAAGKSVRGVQLLGGNITDLAMNQAGAFAQYIRLRPQIIRSGSILRVPASVDQISAALVEPLACLLDCFQKSTHEVGQDEQGSVLRKGVLPGGTTLVIGSGSMALMAGRLALMDDAVIQAGGARQVVFAVRSAAKRDLVMRIMNDERVACVVCDNDAQLSQAIEQQYAGKRRDDTFRGFDDVILAAGNARTVAIAHDFIAPTGARVLTFAGTRGSATIESGVWHYANAGVLGTSGCNTKMMEIALGLLERRSIRLNDLSGRTYTFNDLREGGTAQFFEDQYLRPKLDPQQSEVAM